MKTTRLFILLVVFSTTVIAQKKPKIKGDKEVVTTTNILEKEFNTPGVSRTSLVPQ